MSSLVKDGWWETQCAKKIHDYFQQKEQKQPGTFYRQSPHLNMRQHYVDWMKRACYHTHSVLKKETIHLAVYLLDYTMDDPPDNRCFHPKALAMAAITVAAKFEEKEVDIPHQHELGQISGMPLLQDEFFQLELFILKALKWNIGRVTPAHFYELYLSLGIEDKPVRNGRNVRKTLKKLKQNFKDHYDFFLNVALRDYRIHDYMPSCVTAAAVLATRRLQKLEPEWPSYLENLTGYHTSRLEPCYNFLMRLYEEHSNESKRLSNRSAPVLVSTPPFMTAARRSMASLSLANTPTIGSTAPQITRALPATRAGMVRPALPTPPLHYHYDSRSALFLPPSLAPPFVGPSAVYNPQAQVTPQQPQYYEANRYPPSIAQTGCLPVDPVSGRPQPTLVYPTDNLTAPFDVQMQDFADVIPTLDYQPFINPQYLGIDLMEGVEEQSAVVSQIVPSLSADSVSQETYQSIIPATLSSLDRKIANQENYPSLYPTPPEYEGLMRPVTRCNGHSDTHPAVSYGMNYLSPPSDYHNPAKTTTGNYYGLSLLEGTYSNLLSDGITSQAGRSFVQPRPPLRTNNLGNGGSGIRPLGNATLSFSSLGRGRGRFKRLGKAPDDKLLGSYDASNILVVQRAPKRAKVTPECYGLSVDCLDTWVSAET